MKNRRKLFLRTETFEQILIRQKPAQTDVSKETKNVTTQSSFRGERHRLEIYRIEADGKKRLKVFECEIYGSIEIVETNEDF